MVQENCTMTNTYYANYELLVVVIIQQIKADRLTNKMQLEAESCIRLLFSPPGFKTKRIWVTIFLAPTYLFIIVSDLCKKLGFPGKLQQQCSLILNWAKL